MEIFQSAVKLYKTFDFEIYTLYPPSGSHGREMAVFVLKMACHVLKFLIVYDSKNRPLGILENLTTAKPASSTRGPEDFF